MKKIKETFEDTPEGLTRTETLMDEDTGMLFTRTTWYERTHEPILDPPIPKRG